MIGLELGFYTSVLSKWIRKGAFDGLFWFRPKDNIKQIQNQLAILVDLEKRKKEIHLEIENKFFGGERLAFEGHIRLDHILPLLPFEMVTRKDAEGFWKALARQVDPSF